MSGSVKVNYSFLLCDGCYCYCVFGSHGGL